MASPVVSDDGRRVYFLSNATDLVSGYTTSAWRLYVRDLGSDTTRLVASNACQPSRYVPCALSVSADGLRLAYLRRTTTGSGTGYQAYLHDARARTNVVVSKGSSTPNGEAFAVVVNGPGTRVVFSTRATNVASGGAGTFVRSIS